MRSLAERHGLSLPDVRDPAYVVDYNFLIALFASSVDDSYSQYKKYDNITRTLRKLRFLQPPRNESEQLARKMVKELQSRLHSRRRTEVSPDSSVQRGSESFELLPSIQSKPNLFVTQQDTSTMESCMFKAQRRSVPPMMESVVNSGSAETTSQLPLLTGRRNSY